jgi:hypothetical protein
MSTDEPDLYAPETGEEWAGQIVIQDESGDTLARITPEYAERIVAWLTGTSGAPGGVGLIEFARSQMPGADCSQCDDGIAADDFRADYGMCGSCLHHALRGGWQPGK